MRGASGSSSALGAAAAARRSPTSPRQAGPHSLLYSLLLTLSLHLTPLSLHSFTPLLFRSIPHPSLLLPHSTPLPPYSSFTPLLFHSAPVHSNPLLLRSCSFHSSFTPLLFTPLLFHSSSALFKDVDPDLRPHLQEAETRKPIDSQTITPTPASRKSPAQIHPRRSRGCLRRADSQNLGHRHSCPR